MENVPTKTDLVQIKGKAKNGKVKLVKLDRSFMSRVIQGDKIKRFYEEIKNYALSFEKVKARTSWGAESFSVGNETVIKLVVTGGALCVCLALSPKDYAQKDYPHGDWSSKKEFVATPLLMPVRTAQEAKLARRLIAESFTSRCIYTQEFPVWTDYAASLLNQKDEALIKKNLIKASESEVSEADAQKALTAAAKQQEAEERELDAIAPVKKPRAPAKPKKEKPAKPAPVEPAPVEEAPAASQEEPEIEEVVFELAEPEDEIEEVVFELAEEPVQEGAAELEPEPTPEPEPAPEVEPEPAPASATENDDEEEEVEFEIVAAPAEEAVMESYGVEAATEKMVTLKKYVRGFAAKMKQGDQDRKDYYAEIKAKLLSYKGVRISESFSGDSYKKGMRSLLKSRIRGKTLCLFFALDTDSYKQTVYRQQYKGDTKAYAATPMMVRVKSEQALKRALRLVEELEKNFELQPGAPMDLVAVRGEFLFEETDALVEKGLIKSRTVKVTEAEAERLLNKKA